MALETCPCCSKKLGTPLRSGRQVCMRCGWSDKPRKGQRSSEVPFDAPFDLPPPLWEYGTEEDTRRWLSMLAHGSFFFASTGASVIVPIVLLAVSQDGVIQKNAKEVLNLQISLLIYGLILLILIIVVLHERGIILLFVLPFLIILFPLIAIIHCLKRPNVPFTYPLIIHFLT
ncbi:MAG: DUF4870 domain-containing protein [Leptolyngbyaceae cyanobacterium bins.349]|nr:DUF4870 domain-containing protein [Leptolyngbyaceae cyanobacterium bins.349]